MNSQGIPHNIIYRKQTSCYARHDSIALIQSTQITKKNICVSSKHRMRFFRLVVLVQCLIVRIFMPNTGDNASQTTYPVANGGEVVMQRRAVPMTNSAAEITMEIRRPIRIKYK